MYIHVLGIHTCRKNLLIFFCVVLCEFYIHTKKYQAILNVLVYWCVMWWDIRLHQRLLILCFLPCCFSTFPHPFTWLSICTFFLPSAKIPNFTYVLFASSLSLLLRLLLRMLCDTVAFFACFVVESSHHHHHFMSISAQLLQHKEDFLLCTHNSLKSTWSSDPGSNFFPHSLYYYKVYLYFIVYF